MKDSLPFLHHDQESEVKETLKAMKRAAAMMAQDPELRRQARQASGMYTKDDKLKAKFR